MPRFAFTSSDNVKRETPSAAAVSVIVMPRGSIQSCSTSNPGWGGFFIGITHSPSVVIDIVHVANFALLKLENDPPVPTHYYGIKTLVIPFERVQTIPR